MAKKDKRVDDYIKKAEAFAHPIMVHFRELVHELCPDAEETIKWSFPHFNYKGRVICYMASFKKHCAIGFRNAALLSDAKKLTEKAKTEEAMGHLGKLTSLKDLPKDSVLKKYIKESMRLTDLGVKLPARENRSEKKSELEIPDYFTKALTKNKLAVKVFNGFSYSNKKEYVQWVVSAKTEETKNKRLATAIEWIGEGKVRNWKYLKK